MTKKAKVLVAMSGGVDSTVAAILLQKAGYDLIGVHLHFWADPEVELGLGKLPENKCCSTESLLAAREAAHQLGIPFYVFDFADFFREKVVGHFLVQYSKGKTPNPCATCNQEIKFGKLLEKARELDCEYVATGHYARIKNNKLYKGKDISKDQSYFLYHLDQEKIKHILLPLGEYQKSEIKKIATDFGMKKVASKKESQGACFFAEKTPQAFLKRHLDKKCLRSGKIVDSKGKEYGEHIGLPHYTVGQREGLQIGGLSKPLYVISKDSERNQVIVGEDADIFSDEMIVKNCKFVTGQTPTDEFDCSVMIRLHHPAVPARVVMDNNKAIVKFKKPVRAVTPGQIAAFYDGDQVLGGGEIS